MDRQLVSKLQKFWLKNKSAIEENLVILVMVILFASAISLATAPQNSDPSWLRSETTCK